jgi:1-deoxy-D-xylulose-5-phosphate reductoisomerase
VIVNAANEVAVAKFLRGEITFGALSTLVLDAYERFGDTEPATLEEVFTIDQAVRSWCEGAR